MHGLKGPFSLPGVGSLAEGVDQPVKCEKCNSVLRDKDWAGFRGDTNLLLDEEDFVFDDGTWCIFLVVRKDVSPTPLAICLPDDTVVIHQHGGHTMVTTPYIGLIRRLPFFHSHRRLTILLLPTMVHFSCKATVAFTSFTVVLIVLRRWPSTVAPSVTSAYLLGRRWPVIHFTFILLMNVHRTLGPIWVLLPLEYAL